MQRPLRVLRLAHPAIDNHRRRRILQTPGKDKLASLLQPPVELGDGSHLVRRGRTGALVDHRNQKLHFPPLPALAPKPHPGICRRRISRPTTSCSIWSRVSRAAFSPPPTGSGTRHSTTSRAGSFSGTPLMLTTTS